MSSSIDQRIVEMQFDNKEFESGIQTSLKSIKNLENGLQLKDGAKGFENIGRAANNVSFDGLSTGVMAVQQKFSAMEVVAITALQNIVNKAMAAGEHLVKSLSIDQISAGFEKFSSKTTSVATLVAQGYDIDEVTAQLERLNTFTDETSYNFTDMVSNIAKFTATGKNLTESVTAMEGIANWAAMSGQNAQTASRAMYQLAQAMGAGVMRLEDYKSIQNASMDTDEFRKKCIAAAVSLGTLKDNGNETYSVVSKGAKATAFNVSQFTTQLTDGAWLTSDVMMSVFNDYSNAVNQIVDKADAENTTVSRIIEEIHNKAEEGGISVGEAIKSLGMNFDEFSLKAFEAAQKARTFNDAIDSVKDAVSTGWMKTFEIIFGNANEATEVWTDFANDLYDIFAEGGNKRNEYLQEVLGDTKTFTAEQWKVVEENTNASDSLQQALIETAKAHGIAIDDMIDDNTSFSESLKQGWLTTDIFTETLKNCTSETVASADTLNEKLEEYKKLASEVIQGNYGNGAARKKALADVGKDYATIQGIVNKMLAGVEITVEDLGEEQLKAVGYTDEQVQALQQLAKQAEETGTPLNELLESMNRPSGRELLIDTMRNALHGLMTVINTVKTAWSEVFPPRSAEQVYKIIQAVNEFSKKLNISEDTADKLRRTLKGLFSILGIVSDAVSTLARRAFKVLNAVLGDVNVDVLDFTANVGDTIVKVREWLSSNEILNKSIDKCVDFISEGIVNLKNWIRNNETLNGILSKFNEALSDGVTAIKNWASEHKIVSTILEKISSGFSKLVEWIVKAKNKLVEWFIAFKNLPIVQKAISAFGEIVDKVLRSAKQLLDDLKPYITDFIDKFKNLDGINFETVKSLFETLKSDAGGALDTIISKFGGLNSAIDTFKTNVSAMVSTASEKFEGLKSYIGKFQSFFSKGAKNVAVDKIIVAGVGIGVIASLKKLSDTLSSVKKVGANIGDSFVGVLGALKNVLGAYQKDIEANAIIKIAVAIGALAASLFVVALIPTERLIPAAVAIGVLGGAILGLACLLTDLKGKYGFGITNPLTSLSETLKGFSIGFNAAAIAASVLIIVNVLKELEGIETEGLDGRIDAVVRIITILSLISMAMSKLGGNKFGSAVYLIAMAISLKTVIKALDDIVDHPLDEIWNSLGKMSLILGALSLVCKAASGASFGSAAMLIATAFSLKMFVDILESIAKMQFEDILKGITALVPIMAMMSLLNASTAAAGKNGDGGKSVLLMSAGMYILIEVIKEIASIDPADIAKGIVVLTMMTTIITLYSAAALLSSSNANADKAAIGFLGMAAGIAVLVGCIWAINKIGEDECLKALGVISLIGVLFGALMAVSKLATGSQKTIIAITACVAALTVMVVAISNIPTEDLTPATVAIDSIMVCMALLMAASSLAKKATPGIAVVTLAVAAIGALLYALSDIPNPDSLLPIAESLSLVLIALSAAMAVLSKVPVHGVGQAGIAILAAVGVIVSIMEALGALMQLEWFSGNMDRGIEAIGKIGDAIGQFIGGIIGGIGTGISNALPAIGKNVKGFILDIKSAVQELSEIDQSCVEGAENLSKAVVAITAGNLVSAVLNFLGGGVDYEELKSKFTGLGEAAKAFSDSTQGVSAYQIKNSAEAVRALVEVIDNLNPTGGAWQDFVGTKDLGTFSENLVVLGKALASYSESITDIDPDVVTKSSAAAQTLVDLENGLPSSGGRLQDWFGSKNLGTFGDELTKFGKCLSDYSTAITGSDGGGGVDAAAITATESACKMLVELENSLPSSNGALQNFLGSQNLGEFGKHLTAFASGMKDYSDALTSNGGISTTAIEDSKSACTMLVDLATSVNKLNDGGVEGFWTGSMTLADLGTQLTQFGPGLASFAESVDGLDVDKTSKAIVCMQDLIPVIKDFNELSVLYKQNNNGNIFTRFSEAIKGLDTSGFDTLFSTGYEQMKGAGEKFIQSFIDAVTSKATEITDSANQTVTNFTGGITSAIQSSVPLITIEIDNLMVAVESTISNHEPTVTEAFNNLITAIIGKVKERQPEFTTEGTNDSQSYANGIQNNVAPVTAADNMSNFALQTINAKNSLFNTSGDMSATALANGFAANTLPLDSVNATVDNSLAAIDSRNSSFNKSGDSTATAIASGFRANTSPLDSVNYAMDESLRAIARRNGDNADFNVSGQNSASSVGTGILAKQGEVVSASDDNAQAAIDALNSKSGEFEAVGGFSMDGFINGMKLKIQDIANTAAQAASKALESAKEALGVASPSKEFLKIGVFTVEGFVNGMKQMMSQVAAYGTTLGATVMSSTEMALRGFSDLIENGIDAEPTIRPVIDLSNVESGLSRIDGLLGDTRTLSLAGSISRMNSVARQMNSTDSDVVGNQKDSNVVNYNFTQNNYSPKSLSRSEIYRDSKNLFATMKSKGASK